MHGDDAGRIQLQGPPGNLPWVDAGLGQRAVEEFFKTNQSMPRIQEQRPKDLGTQASQLIHQKTGDVIGPMDDRLVFQRLGGGAPGQFPRGLKQGGSGGADPLGGLQLFPRRGQDGRDTAEASEKFLGQLHHRFARLPGAEQNRKKFCIVKAFHPEGEELFSWSHRIHQCAPKMVDYSRLPVGGLSPDWPMSFTSSASPGIQNGSHVTLHFRLTLSDGQVVLDTFSDKPATIQVGEGHIAPALERCLIALQEGDERTYSLAADDGFGPRNPELVQKISKALMDKYSDQSDPIAPGDVVEFPTPDASGGRVAGVFKGWDGEAAIFDFNHPLAGQPLTFDVRIIGLL